MDDERTTLCDETPRRRRQHASHEICTIGEVLAELLAQYQTRYPDIRVTVVEVAPVAA
ncbi:MAG: hypothetical protein NUV77_04885 [Thermoguttaceae bacterium]|jgi:DNA-binding transcriptional LysR family regulator|nr:hypothetical protein [Thermoguttaceae bacterium]